MPYIQLEKYYSTLINPKRNRRRKAIKAAGGIRQFKRQRSAVKRYQKKWEAIEVAFAGANESNHNL